MKSIIPLGIGRMSTFGGPADSGVGTEEGLALIGPTDLAFWWFSYLFLAVSASGDTGLARRLNPRAYYCALRWNEVLPARLPYWVDAQRSARDPDTLHTLRVAMVRLTNPRNGFCVLARAVDYGPGDGRMVDGHPTVDTGRLADLSPGAATALMLATDDLVCCELILPEAEPAVSSPVAAPAGQPVGESTPDAPRPSGDTARAPLSTSTKPQNSPSLSAGVPVANGTPAIASASALGGGRPLSNTSTAALEQTGSPRLAAVDGKEAA